MTRYLLMMLVATCALPGFASAKDNQILELRTYTLVDEAAEQRLDRYFELALIPALVRQGLGPIGAFAQASETEGGTIQVMLLVPGPDVESVTAAAAKLSSDDQYLRAARAYLDTPANEPLIKRIRSELLVSFDCWPKVVVPQQTQEGQERLFELRIYESPTERRGQLKVEMFNSGEVPIFLESGIMPVFMGQALIGDKLPNLSYMTVYDNDQARQAAWKKFSAHRDWQTLKAVEKYQGTVSKIHKSDWRPKSYSQL